MSLPTPPLPRTRVTSQPARPTRCSTTMQSPAVWSCGRDPTNMMQSTRRRRRAAPVRGDAKKKTGHGLVGVAFVHPANHAGYGIYHIQFSFWMGGQALLRIRSKWVNGAGKVLASSGLPAYLLFSSTYRVGIHPPMLPSTMHQHP